MASSYGQLDPEIKSLIRQGCSPSQVAQQLLQQYPQLVSEAAKVLKHVQAIERGMR
jgi:hypothetical protein